MPNGHSQSQHGLSLLAGIYKTPCCQPKLAFMWLCSTVNEISATVFVAAVRSSDRREKWYHLIENCIVRLRTLCNMLLKV